DGLRLVARGGERRHDLELGRHHTDRTGEVRQSGMATERRLVLRALVLAVVVEHLLLEVAPLDVLAPLDPWRIGQRLLHGQLPYRDFPFEYPPLAAVAFLFPGLASHGAARSVLALQEVAVEAVMVWFVFRGR